MAPTPTRCGSSKSCTPAGGEIPVDDSGRGRRRAGELLSAPDRPRVDRALALGIRQPAVPLGGAIAAVLLPALAAGPGLRSAFIALAIGSGLGAAVGLALLRDAPAGDLEAELVRPLRDRRLWLLCGGSTLYLAGQ